jgi:hypothetical protein
MKTISMFLALINSIVAGFLLALTLSITQIHNIQFLWSLTKFTASMSVITIGVLTWVAGARPVASSLLPLAGLFLVILGTGTLVWTFQNGLLTGNMEYAMTFFGGSLMAQGLTSLLGFAGDSRGMAAT